MNADLLKHFKAYIFSLGLFNMLLNFICQWEELSEPKFFVYVSLIVARIYKNS